MTLILVGGGSRSGKSRHAQELALAAAGPERPCYIATAVVDGDDEMAERVQRHRDDRGDAFVTEEVPLELAEALRRIPAHRTVIVDCLTVWLANVLFANRTPDHAAVIAAARSRAGTTILVTNEVGEGIVPMHPVSRAFRDEAGFMNQAMATAADEVVFLRFGIPQRVK